MKLRYITLHIGNVYQLVKTTSTFDDDGKISAFYDHARFLSNYLSIQVQKLKLENNDNYKMLSIHLVNNKLEDCELRTMAENTVSIEIPFSDDQYEAYVNLSEIEKYNFYLSSLQQGYERAKTKYSSVPVKELLSLHQQFINGGYKNEWLHKKKQVKEYGINLSLYCYFTSIDFKLKLIVTDIKSKQEIVSKVILRTAPSEYCYDHRFKDIIINSTKLIITNFLNEPAFTFKLKDLSKGVFDMTNLSDDYIDCILQIK